MDPVTMANMSKQNGATPPSEGTAAAVREAARASMPLAPAATTKAKRRTFTAAFKQQVLREVDAAVASGRDGATGEILRRHALYSSHLTVWRRERDAGELAALSPRKRGRKPSRNALADEVARLERENARLQDKLRKSEIIIDVQKKLAALLGETLPVPTEVEFARGLLSRRSR